MGRYLGTKSVLYVSSAVATAAANLPDLTQFSIDNSKALVDVTACGDPHMKYVPALSDFKGESEIFFDDANTAALFVAAASTTGVNMYAYPSSDCPTLYAYGTAWIAGTKFSTGGVNAPIKVSFNWGAKGTWTWKLS